ncbi:hypothetical protein M408DRAFT_273013 [Serendipita vermifera MAFF 305830]|uniref:Uncharacterized protein n=1 Tax=Serendipita vermifera MAFF 305830 TaxID=933852 RepID=A0A0C3B286_SERVB|nr:hypothetical protein M408DRAFT_273013 [Serendipita vermifera MAFF 305830]
MAKLTQNFKRHSCQSHRVFAKIRRIDEPGWQDKIDRISRLDRPVLLPCSVVWKFSLHPCPCVTSPPSIRNIQRIGETVHLPTPAVPKDSIHT